MRQKQFGVQKVIDPAGRGQLQLCTEYPYNKKETESKNDRKNFEIENVRVFLLIIQDKTNCIRYTGVLRA